MNASYVSTVNESSILEFSIHRGYPDKPEANGNKTWSMLVAIQLDIDVGNEESSFMSTSSILSKINLFLLENISSEDLNHNHVCRHLGMSKSKLYRYLKSKTDKSINIYIRSFRLSVAKNLLLTTNRNVSEVCYQVGFKDLSYFSRSFSKEFGIAPSAIRKNISNNAST